MKASQLRTGSAFGILVTTITIAVIAGSCTSEGTVTGESDATAEPTSTNADAATTSTIGSSTTLPEAPVDGVPLLDEPPDFEEITITTGDGVDLYAKFWSGGPIAVLAGHDFNNRGVGSFTPVPQSSDVLLWWTGALADAGYTVLSPDYRGHGRSEGKPKVKDSQTDLKAAYDYLVDAGHETVVLAGFVGSGTAGVVLDASDDEVSFDGIALLWSPPQDTGLDASRALPDITAPVYVVGIDTARSARWAKMMSQQANNLYDLHIYPTVPTGVQFTDVYGEEFLGRLLAFVASIEGADGGS